ncbi:hypothetical protein D3C83_124070 [compost metagenome]
MMFALQHFDISCGYAINIRSATVDWKPRRSSHVGGWNGLLGAVEDTLRHLDSRIRDAPRYRDPAGDLALARLGLQKRVIA